MKRKPRPLSGPTLLSRDTDAAVRGASIILAAAIMLTLGAAGFKQMYLAMKAPEFRQLYGMEMMTDARIYDTVLTKDILDAANEVGVKEVYFWSGPTVGASNECLLLAIPMTEEQQSTEMFYTKESYEFDETEKTFKKVKSKEKVDGADFLRQTIADLMSDYILGIGEDSINFQVTSNDTGIIAMLGTETGKFVANFAYVMENHGGESVAVQFELLKDSFDKPATIV